MLLTTWPLVITIQAIYAACIDTKTASITATDLTITSTINCNDETIEFDITYTGYKSNWFGIVFNTEMSGDAIVYTSGKSDDRIPKLCSYYITSMDPSGVTYLPNEDYTEISTDTSNGIHIVYQQQLSQTSWNIDTESIEFRYAIGSALRLGYHSFRSEYIYFLEMASDDGSDAKDINMNIDYNNIKFDDNNSSNFIKLFFETKLNRFLMVLIIAVAFANFCVWCQIKYELKLRKDVELRNYYQDNNDLVLNHKYIYNQQSEISEFNMDDGPRN